MVWRVLRLTGVTPETQTGILHPSWLQALGLQRVSDWGQEPVEYHQYDIILPDSSTRGHRILFSISWINL